MPQAPDKPLLTFAIAALNQEAFIREAVAAAFAQTYSPLEIILSDDHSRDRTFIIMQEMAAAYDGPHKVILNQNPRRRCIGGHINRIVEISHGELIVGAAGDDISLPDRTEQAFALWDTSGRQATSIHSGFIQIDESGNTIPPRYRPSSAAENEEVVEQQGDAVTYVKTLEPCIFGCAHSFSRSLFRLFGELPENIIHEDNALGLRSLLGGKIIYAPKPMVKYRVHNNNIYATRDLRNFKVLALEQEEDRLRRTFVNREIMYAGFLPDLKKALQLALIDQSVETRATAEAVQMQRRFSLLAGFLESNFPAKLKILTQLRRLGMGYRELLTLSKRLLPRPVFVRVRLVLSYASLLSRSFGRGQSKRLSVPALADR